MIGRQVVRICGRCSVLNSLRLKVSLGRREDLKFEGPKAPWKLMSRNVTNLSERSYKTQCQRERVTLDESDMRSETVMLNDPSVVDCKMMREHKATV